MNRREQRRRAAPFAALMLAVVHLLPDSPVSSAQSPQQDPQCPEGGPSVAILSPAQGSHIALELHGLGSYDVELEVLICNFEGGTSGATRRIAASLLVHRGPGGAPRGSRGAFPCEQARSASSPTTGSPR
jgi:hypothetical protein